MNKARRKEIEKVIIKLEDIKTEIQSLQEEESEYAEGVADNFIEKKEKAEQNAEYLDEAANAVDEIIESLNNAME